MLRHAYLWLMILGVCMPGAGSVLAQTSLNTVTPIDFGLFIIDNQSVATTVQVNTDGTFSASAQLTMIEDPTPAEMRIDNISEGTPVTVLFTDGTITSISNPTDPTMTVTDFVIDPASVVGLPGDTASFMVGATLELLGAGSTYQESNFSGTFNVEITF